MVPDSLLVVVGREAESQLALRKALMLARHTGARVELLLCEPEPVTAASRGSACRILEALRGSIAADDVTIETHWAGGASLREAIACRLADARDCIVLRSIAGATASGSARSAAAERDLLLGCDAPLWLTRRAAWAPQPRFVLGSAAGSGEAWTGTAARLARALARGCGAQVERAARGELPSRIDAFFAPAARPGEAAATAWVEGLIRQLDCDLVFVPAAAAAGALPFSPWRDAPVLSS